MCCETQQTEVGWLLTRYCLCMAAALAAGDENDIALARVGIIVFQDEKLVDAILLEGGNLDYYADGAD
jgi:hypothetical protein